MHAHSEQSTGAGNDTIVCWGEVLWDLFPDGPQLGGAVANVAYHVACLGGRARLVSRLGNDELGRRAMARLRGAGVDVECVQIDPARPTGQVNVRVVAGEAQYSLSTGGAWEHIELSAAARAAVETASYLSVGTLAQRHPDGRASLERALALAPSSCRVAVDANVRPGHLDAGWLRALLERADVVKINEAEAALIEREVCGADPIAWLHEHAGVEIVALTLGKAGCVLSRRGAGHVRHAGHPATPGGDSVGAGDAFLAALLVGLTRGWSLETLADRANHYAARIASQRGATAPV